MAEFLLTLDVPYSFPVEPGFQRSPMMREFAPLKDSFNNTYLDPATGVLMLRPSVLKRDFDADFKKLDQWRFTPNWWKDNYRGQDAGASNPNMMSAVKPTGSGFTLIELLVTVALVALEASAARLDDLKWVLESKFSLEVDEGFCIHYHTLGDEFRRKRNWYKVQWDNIGFHFSFDGRCRVYEYERGNLTATPTLIEEFEIASPGELLNNSGYFFFLPIPEFGVSISHSRVPQKNIFSPANVQSGVTRSHLVKWPTRTISGNKRLFESSLVRIAHNPYIKPVIGFQSITYTAGDFTDAVFDPGFVPSVNPSRLSAYPLPTGYGTVTTTLRKADNSGAWVAGTDRQARTKIALTPDAGGKHTPFIRFWDVAWEPQFATRNTTPLELARFAENSTNRLMRLEWSEDDMARFEGKATAMMSTTAAKAIALRGDASFLLQWRNLSTDAWQTLFGGFATDWTVDVMHDNAFGTWFLCDFALKDMHHRMRETHRLFEGAYDGDTVGGALNQLMRGCSLPALSTLPTELNTTLIPRKEDGKTWRFAPKEGDRSEEILRVLLLLLHTQGVEWRLRWDWSLGKFVPEKKPKLTGGDGWTLAAYDELRNAAAKIWCYSNANEAPQIRPEPPEANLIIMEGLTDSSPDAKRVIVPISNDDSINNPASPDYLGRTRVAKIPVHGVTDKNELALMARRVKDAISHRRASEMIPIDYLQMALSPGVQVTQYDSAGVLLLQAFIKFRSVIVEEEGDERMLLGVDTVWEGEWE
jgi:prepilin-type N-terminal cleavage/methylation domain-containing protein